MEGKNIPTRLVLCIDGTYCTPDGPDGKGHGNISNVYRVKASVKDGVCYDPIAKKSFDQRALYYSGIGAADDIGTWTKTKAGIGGFGFMDLIKQVYEQCCKLEGKDEVWLYGFSRGAFIARAVAGLLHFVGALRSAGTDKFSSDYNEVWKIYKKPDERSRIGPGQIDHILSQAAKKEKPKIQFVGVFDTVMAVHDERSYDISLNTAIIHFRHAVALHEDRKAMKVEHVVPEYNDIKTQASSRTCIEAWFIGAHLDMGGSSKRDGLSLYPLQWMISESRARGLVLGFSPAPNPRTKIDNPLDLVFPDSKPGGQNQGEWTYKMENGIQVTVYDIREIHERQDYGTRYALSLNRGSRLWPRMKRDIFTSEGQLRGYYPHAPGGTIIHPSVYQILETSHHISTDKGLLSDRDKIDSLRSEMLGEDKQKLVQGFWNISSGPSETVDLQYIRILVCGNAGVGKSTLINRMFSVDDATLVSDRESGIHDITKEITHENRPNLRLHDSGGFEAGDTSQFQAVEKFVDEKAQRLNLEERLHLIWFCIDMNNPRTKQTATAKLFEAVSKHATDIPIIVVITKKDQFQAIKYFEARKLLRDVPNATEELFLDYAETEIQNRMNEIENEMASIQHGRFDACVAISRDEPSSIDILNKVTLDSFSHERLRFIYIATQTASIDMKVDRAISETMRKYRKILGTTAGLSLFPGAATSNRTAAAISVCKGIVGCFGLPTLDASSVYEIVKHNLWDDINHNIAILFAEGIAAVSLLGTIATAGFPFFLLSSTSIPLVVPATTRLMLMLASDLILILVRACRSTLSRGHGPPMTRDVEMAAIENRKVVNQVHKEVGEIVPRRNFVKSFLHNQVESKLKDLIYRFKDEVLDNTESLSVHSLNIGETPGEREDRRIANEQVEEIKEDILPDYREVVGFAASEGLIDQKKDIVEPSQLPATHTE